MMVGLFYVQIGNVSVTKQQSKVSQAWRNVSNIDWKFWSFFFYFLLSEFYINGKKEERNNFVY